MLKACIFDMDGVLLDSEPFWRKAEREEFGKVGLTLTEKDCMETMGIRIDEVVALRYAQKPWDTPSQAEVADRIVKRVAELVKQKGSPKPGVNYAINYLKNQNVPLGLATSSSRILIDAVLECLDLTDAFDLVHSAENETYGKPHPAVYLTAADKMGIDPCEILAIEDSFSGVISAKAARMTVCAIPEEAVADEPHFAAADARLKSLEELPALWEKLKGQAQ
ncbi:MAG: hexitol phosphatase HxpB [bacterium]|nr:hexitol phosphatase HxpB [bacterium]